VLGSIFMWPNLALIQCKECLEQINNCQIFKSLLDISVKYRDVAPVMAPIIIFLQLKCVHDDNQIP
jgi:hypothetical protein